MDFCRIQNKKKVRFWNDSILKRKPPSKSTAYFYKHKPSIIMTILHLK